MIYVPTLRYRQEERAALRNINFSQKTIPLIEIIKELPRANRKGSFQDVYVVDFEAINAPRIMVDFPSYIRLSARTIKGVEPFLRPLQQNALLKIKYFNKLSSLSEKIIPVISYNPDTTYRNRETMQIEKKLRNNYPVIAYRIFLNQFANVLPEIATVIQKNDILIFDIDTAPHNNKILDRCYQQINNLKQQLNITTILLRSALNNDITNIGLIDGQPVPQADNSLLTDFQNKNFTGFGDFAGVKKDDLIRGGSISPGVIYYSWQENNYTGFKGRKRKLSEFQNHITPLLINSSCYTQYSASHHQNCPGCVSINKISSGIESGSSQAKWKRISIMHYLYTMEEFL